jgi:hypothetical protein
VRMSRDNRETSLTHRAPLAGNRVPEQFLKDQYLRSASISAVYVLPSKNSVSGLIRNSSGQSERQCPITLNDGKWPVGA